MKRIVGFQRQYRFAMASGVADGYTKRSVCFQRQFRFANALRQRRNVADVSENATTLPDGSKKTPKVTPGDSGIMTCYNDVVLLSRMM